MQLYANLNGNSGVSRFETGEDYIIVEFTTGAVYTYTYLSAGKEHIETMKSLALSGRGLNSYINKYARKLYA